MSMKLTSGSDRDDDPPAALDPADQADVLEELERALEASLAEIELATLPVHPPAAQDHAASPEHEPVEPAASQPEDFHGHGLRARATANVTPTPQWLRTSPPFVPHDRIPWPEAAQPVQPAAVGNGAEPLRRAHPHAARTFGKRPAPVFLRNAHPQPAQPANDLRSGRPPPENLRRREPSRHGQIAPWHGDARQDDAYQDDSQHDNAQHDNARQDSAWQDNARKDDVLRRLTQRPPAEADETLDRSSPQRSRLARVGQAALATVLAGGVAFGLLQLLNLRPPSSGGKEKLGIASLSPFAGGTASSVATPGKNPRLVTSALSGATNRPVAFGVNVEGAAPGASIVVRGMPAGSRMTAGSAEGEGTWRVPVRELARAAVMPPPDFVGTMNLSVDLRLADGGVADSDVQQLKWTAGAPDLVVPKPVTTTVVRPNAGPFPPPAPRAVAIAPAAADSKTQVAEPGSARAPAPAARQLERDEIANLLKRGQSALQNADISAARLLLRRAAEAGDAQAALALAATYDPAALKEIGALGAKADLAQARLWYRRAADAGSTEALQRLQLIAQQSP